MINTDGLCLGCMSDNGGEKVCPICGFDNASQNPSYALPLKSLLENRYFIGKTLSADGEGITYIGWDNSKNCKITIKEYFPKGFANRNPDKTISMSESGKYTFNEGLLEFLDINRAIILSTLPSLMPVYDTFEANGTAYAVCELISGITLEEFLNKNSGALKWEQARPLFLPLIDTIEGMNSIGYIHGGISSETIIVGRDGKLRISGYSIKKLRKSSELEPLLYSGFAACEQYGIEDLLVDTYTDVYGLCATLFRVLIGSVPPTSTQRLENDAMTISAKFAEELPHQVLAALANGLQVKPENRTRNIEQFKNELVYGEIETPAPVKKKVVSKEVSSTTKKKKNNGTSKYVVISALCTVLILGLLALLLFKDSIFSTQNDNSSQTESVVSFDAPDVNSVGDIESGTEITTKTYVVPDLVGKHSFAEILENEEWEMFEFVLTDKDYSDTCAKGTVCAQSVKAGTEVVRDTKIEVVVSLGTKEFDIRNVKNLKEEEALLELLKQGFLYENIVVEEIQDPSQEYGVVIRQEPEYGEKVTAEAIVTITVNRYKDNSSSSNSNR